MTLAPVAEPLPGGRRWPGSTPERAPRWCSLDVSSVLGHAPLAARLALVDSLAAVGVHVVDLGDPAGREGDMALCREIAARGRDEHAPSFQLRAGTSPRTLGRLQQATEGLARPVWHWVPGEDDDLKAGLASLREAAMAVADPSGVTLRVSPSGLQGRDLAAAQRTCHAIAQGWEFEQRYPVIVDLRPVQAPVWPHEYADFAERLVNLVPEGVAVSVTPSNRLGTAVASAALALLAGVSEVQGVMLAHRDLLDLGMLGRNLRAAGLSSGLGVLQGREPSPVDGLAAADSLRDHYGLRLPAELGRECQKLVGAEPSLASDPESLWRAFKREYLALGGPFACARHDLRREDGNLRLSAGFVYNSRPISAEGKGVGPLSAFVDAVNRGLGLALRVVDYSGHARSEGNGAEAVAYVRLMVGEQGPVFGCAIDRDMTVASLQAVVAAVNRAFRIAGHG